MKALFVLLLLEFIQEVLLLSGGGVYVVEFIHSRLQFCGQDYLFLLVGRGWRWWRKNVALVVEKCVSRFLVSVSF